MELVKNDVMAKVLVLGDIGVGKTSIIKRYVHNMFSNGYKSTIGVDFALKTEYVGDTAVQMQFWDIGGQERFSSMTGVYYRDAHAALVVYDVGAIASFDACIKWKADLDAKLQPAPYTLLVGNKCDVTGKLRPSTADVEAMMRHCHFDAHVELSARTGDGVADACRALATEMAHRLERARSPVPPLDLVHLTPTHYKEKSGCC